MSTPSPWLRPLQGLATLLAIAMLALFVAWLGLAPPLASTGPVEPAMPRAQDVAAANAGIDDVRGSTDAQPAVATSAAETTPAAASNAVLFGTFKRADGSQVT